MRDINLLDELYKEKDAFIQDQLVNEALDLLSNDARHENAIGTRMKEGNKSSLRLLPEEHDRVFNVQVIETICTRYRMRFLDAAMFKAEIPMEAMAITRRLENRWNTKIESFKILAPAERFHLKDSTKDPILFAEMADGNYYFIYQWGDDMSWYNRMLKFPFQHMTSLAISAAVIGGLITIFTPGEFATWQADFFFRFFLFSMSTCLIMTLGIIAGILHSKDFSENVWNSRFLK